MAANESSTVVAGVIAGSRKCDDPSPTSPPVEISTRIYVSMYAKILLNVSCIAANIAHVHAHVFLFLCVDYKGTCMAYTQDTYIFKNMCDRNPKINMIYVYV
jgi:hypothetical protein